MKIKKVIQLEECGARNCPQIFDTGGNSVIIKGKKVKSKMRKFISIKAEEEAIEIPYGLIDNLIKHRNNKK